MKQCIFAGKTALKIIPSWKGLTKGSEHMEAPGSCCSLDITWLQRTTLNSQKPEKYILAFHCFLVKGADSLEDFI